MNHTHMTLFSTRLAKFPLPARVLGGLPRRLLRIRRFGLVLLVICKAQYVLEGYLPPDSILRSPA